MKSKTFKIPLRKKSDSPFRNVSNDVKAIGQARRAMFGDNIFNIKPDVVPWSCSMCGKTATTGECNKSCGYG